MKCMRRLILFVLLQCAAIAPAAQAAPIAFTFTTTGAGTWERADGTTSSFGLSTLIEVTLLADTLQFQDPILLYPGGNASPIGAVGYGYGALVTASLAVAGVPFGAFTHPAYVFQTGSMVGFGDAVDLDIFGLLAGPLAAYDLRGAFATTSGSPYFPGLATIALASGDRVTLTDLSEAYGVRFSATMPPQEPAAVPEPATMVLLLTGMAALPLSRRRRAKRRGAAPDACERMPQAR